MKLKLNLNTLVLFWVSSKGKSNLVSFITKLIFILLFSLTVFVSPLSSIISSFLFKTISLVEVDISFLLNCCSKVFANLSPNNFFFSLFSSKYFFISVSSLLLSSVE